MELDFSFYSKGVFEIILLLIPSKNSLLQYHQMDGESVKYAIHLYISPDNILLSSTLQMRFWLVCGIPAQDVCWTLGQYCNPLFINSFWISFFLGGRGNLGEFTVPLLALFYTKLSTQKCLPFFGGGEFQWTIYFIKEASELQCHRFVTFVTYKSLMLRRDYIFPRDSEQ